MGLKYRELEKISSGHLVLKSDQNGIEIEQFNETPGLQDELKSDQNGIEIRFSSRNWLYLLHS